MTTEKRVSFKKRQLRDIVESGLHEREPQCGM